MLTDVTVGNTKPKDIAYKLTDEKYMYILVQKTGGKSCRFDYRFLVK